MKKNIMIFSPARSGSTLLSLIIGAHSNVTNFGESHWASIDSSSKRKKSRSVGASEIICQAHGEDCVILQEIKKNLMYSNHLNTLSKFSDTEYILTSNKHKGHYAKMDYKDFQNYVLLMYKPIEVWAGSFLTPAKRRKMKLPESNMEAMKNLSDIFYGYYDKNVGFLEENEYFNNIFVVNYLKLVEDTEEHVKEICEFLNLEYESSMLKFNTYLVSGHSGQHPVGGNRKTYLTSNNNKDKRYQKDIDNIYHEAKYRKFFDEKDLESIRNDARNAELSSTLGI